MDITIRNEPFSRKYKQTLNLHPKSEIQTDPMYLLAYHFVHLYFLNNFFMSYYFMADAFIQCIQATFYHARFEAMTFN